MSNHLNLKLKSKKIAFFGGSFNPLHYAHLELLAFIKKKKLVDEVIIVPNFANPLENKKQYLSKEIRWYILKQVFQERVFQGEIFFHLWGYEFFQKKAVFTEESIKLLKKNFPKKEFYLVLGSDAFKKIGEWKSAAYLKKSTHFIVFQREGFEPIQLKDFSSFKIFIPDKKISNIRSSDLIEEEKDYKSYAEEMKNQFQKLLEAFE